MPISTTITNNDTAESLLIMGFVNPGDSTRALLAEVGPGASYTFTVQDGSSSHLQVNPPDVADPPAPIENTEAEDQSNFTPAPETTAQGE